VVDGPGSSGELRPLEWGDGTLTSMTEAGSVAGTLVTVGKVPRRKRAVKGLLDPAEEPEEIDPRAEMVSAEALAHKRASIALMAAGDSDSPAAAPSPIARTGSCTSITGSKPELSRRGTRRAPPRGLPADFFEQEEVLSDEEAEAPQPVEEPAAPAEEVKDPYSEWLLVGAHRTYEDGEELDYDDIDFGALPPEIFDVGNVGGSPPLALFEARLQDHLLKEEARLAVSSPTPTPAAPLVIEIEPAAAESPLEEAEAVPAAEAAAPTPEVVTGLVPLPEVELEEALLARYRKEQEQIRLTASAPALRQMCTSDLEERWEDETEIMIARRLCSAAPSRLNAGQAASAAALRRIQSLTKSHHLSEKMRNDPNVRFAPSQTLARSVSASLSAFGAKERAVERLKSPNVAAPRQERRTLNTPPVPTREGLVRTIDSRLGAGNGAGGDGYSPNFLVRRRGSGTVNPLSSIHRLGKE